MKALKLVAAILVMALTTPCATADDIMRITYKDGRTSKYRVESIDDMRFETRTYIDGYECVDLGLPSGVMWATCNIGAKNPADYGSYFAWGETSTKGTYDIFKSRFAQKLHSWLLENNVIDLGDNLTADYDAAQQAWGGAWRMPTDAEFQELKDNCTFTATTLNGYNGCLITGPNGKSIFMPSAGNYHGFQSEHGRYWGATVFTADDRAMAFYFDENSCYNTKELFGTGLPVRPVAFDSNVTRIAVPVNAAGTFDSNSVTLTWDAVDAATSYSIYRSAEGNTYTLIGTSTTNTYTDDSPEVGDNYYRIQAWGADHSRSALSTPTKPIVTPGATNASHQYVDLSLPSGTLWATCNIGSDTPAGYGDFYAWGETDTKPTFTTGNCKWHSKSYSWLQNEGVLDNDNNLTADYDAATVHWGDAWRMPTNTEIAELISSCTWEWGTLEGHFGITATGPNGNSIFFPASGYRTDSEFNNTIYDGYYWGASPDDSYSANMLRFDDYRPERSQYYRYWGATIRPVYHSTQQ